MSSLKRNHKHDKQDFCIKIMVIFPLEFNNIFLAILVCYSDYFRAWHTDLINKKTICSQEFLNIKNNLVKGILEHNLKWRLINFH